MEPVRPSLKSRVQELPNKLGVYLTRNRLARVIYVGKVRLLWHRFGPYFQPSHEMRAGPKSRTL